MTHVASDIDQLEPYPSRRLSLRTAIERVLLGILLVRGSLDNLLNALGGPVGALLNFAIIAGTVALFRAQGGRRLSVGPWWLAFLGMCALSMIYAPDKAAAFRLFAVLCTYYAVFIFPSTIIRHESDVIRIVRLLFLSAIIPIAYGFADIMRERAQSTFPHPNIFAFYLSLVILTVAFTWSSRLFTHRTLDRAILLGIGLSSGLLLLMTQTRGAWAGLAASLAVFAVMYDRRFIIGLFFLPLVYFLPQVQERLSDLGEATEFVGNGMIANSYEWRRMLWEAAMGWFYQNPIVGFGLNSFSYYSPQFFRWEEQGFNSHSVYVQILFELGVFGFALFIMLFGSISFSAFKARRRTREAFVFIVTLCLFYMVICYSDNILYYLSFDWYFWLMLGTMRAWAMLPETSAVATNGLSDGPLLQLSPLRGQP